MRRLMIGISGVRGVVGETLTPELLIRLGEAFGTFTEGGKIVVGRDTRTSGEMVKHAVLSGLLSSGCEIIDVGVCSTPSAAIRVRELKADGGVVISASHNSAEWNALKFFRPDGVYLNDLQGRQLLDIYYQGDFSQVDWDGVREVHEDHTASERHVERVLKLVDVKAMRRRKFSVAVDCCNGAGVDMTTMFLNRLNCRVHKLYCTPDGIFPRTPEPTKDNVTELTKLVKKQKCDIGFALDPDADRVAYVSEKGNYIGEEYSMVLCARYQLSKKKGPVVTNVSTSRMIDDVAAEFNSKVIRVPVGEVNVADKMIDIKAVLGGEGNGGVILPQINYSRDSLTGMALMMQYMLESGQTVSELVSEVPKYTMVKEKTECDRMAVTAITKKLLETSDCEDVDVQDGVKLIWKDSWVHLRASNTEPVLRVISEAKTAKQAKEIADKYCKFVAKEMKALKKK
ncbi:MAG: phosphoglucosamine mutase [Planctomycetota bacterium]